MSQKIEETINQLAEQLDGLRQLVTTYPAKLWDEVTVNISMATGNIELTFYSHDDECKEFARQHREGNWTRKYVQHDGGAYSWYGQLCGMPICFYACEPLKPADYQKQVFPEDEQAVKDMAEQAEAIAKEEHASFTMTPIGAVSNASFQNH